VCVVCGEHRSVSSKFESGVSNVEYQIECARQHTNLEDIGNGESVLRHLAAGGDDGDGRPRHVENVGWTAVSIVSWDREVAGHWRSSCAQIRLTPKQLGDYLLNLGE
jgi:hypothetical protein